MKINSEKWVEQYGDSLYRFSLYRVRDSDVAEELVQETLCAALEARERYSGKSSEKTWLFGILKHKIADNFRKSSRSKSDIDSSDLPDSQGDDFFDKNGHWRAMPKKWKGSPEDVLENKEFWQVLSQCMDSLPPKIRQAFALREMDGMESVDICKVMGSSATNLWVMLHRARKGLSRCLELNWFGEKR